ncbi:sugar ABC transporter substrate-binding protein [Xylanibacillus composti]|uniref:Sugar ABC transporter substrate-binding protein n=1 Tax=Xylanibacillus composti TaxID=1572762 RepID=A0A8J4H3Y4_9BACL|nr:ABC transporter substrate-binding protein [Xylanibacillus composti]GIQ70513.1 sugar ABC transporter substrate-binding protein [Xylanibacillus composti]
MRGKKFWLVALSLVFVLSLLAACGGNNNANEPANNTGNNSSSNGGNAGGGGDAAPEDISGEITVLTQRTDIVDSVFRQQYVPRFNEKYPNIKVNFEAITDYEGQVKIRMNTKDYGDVLLIPNYVLPQDLPDYFEPLGTVEELSEKYLFVNEQQYEGISYGIPITVNAQGIVYNKKVFEAAGVTDVPKTPEQFMDALRAIKEKTDAIPLYTNYAAGWPLDQWEGNRTSVAGDPKFTNYTLVRDKAPFSEGKPHYVIYKLMYDAAKEGLIESDPTTTDWETSKPMIANGEIATMVLGSWAITQMQEFADDPNDIGYMPFPYTNADGNVYSSSGGDFKQAINVHSSNKEAARAWVFWFADESGYAVSEGGISPLKGEAMPETLKAFDDLGVVLISEEPAPDEENGWLTMIDQQSEVGLFASNFKQRIIEAAIGNRNETIEDIFADLNERWGKAVEQVTGE